MAVTSTNLHMIGTTYDTNMDADWYTTTAPSNTTFNVTTTMPSISRNEDLAKIEIAVQAAILFLAVFGNSLVLIVLRLRRKKLSRMNLLIVHLSLADLFVAFFNILPQLIWDVTFRFQGNDFLCRSVKFLQVAAMYASSYVLVTTAIDRYLAICHPLTSHTWSSKKVHLMVAVAWGLSLAFSIPQMVIFAYREVVPGYHDCWAVFNPIWTVKLYVTWFFLAVYLIPACILTFAYGRICFVVWRSVMSKEPSRKDRTDHHNKQVSENGEPSVTDSLNSRVTKSGHARKDNSKPRAHVRSMSGAKLKTVKLTLAVVICYLVCWSPFFISQMWGAWDPNAPFEASSIVIMMLLASLNSCTNPWIYLAFSDRLITQCLRAGRTRHDRTSGAYDSESRTKLSTMTENTITLEQYRH